MNRRTGTGHLTRGSGGYPPWAVRASAVDRDRVWDAIECHAYWPLTEPVLPDELERANRRLAHALGADPASPDAARILRTDPHTLSWKDEPPTAIRLKTGRRIRTADVVGALPDPPAAHHPAMACAELRGDDPLLAISPDVVRAAAARRRGTAPSQGPLPVP